MNQKMEIELRKYSFVFPEGSNRKEEKEKNKKRPKMGNIKKHLAESNSLFRLSFDTFDFIFQTFGKSCIRNYNPILHKQKTPCKALLIAVYYTMYNFYLVQQNDNSVAFGFDTAVKSW